MVCSAGPRTNGPITTLLVDDHELLRDGLRRLIEDQPDITVLGECSDGTGALELVKATKPNVLVLDLQMPGMDGFEVARQVVPAVPATKVLVLSTFHTSGQAIRAFEAGASGYVLKTSIRRELLDGIRAVAAGRRFVCAEIAKEVAAQVFDERLTEREVQLLTLMAEGNQNKQIAWSLSLSENTIKGMLKTLFQKLGAKDRTHAVVIASRMGWIRL
jgi:DNA-binding NarL/FixJ family response regulator